MIATEILTALLIAFVLSFIFLSFTRNRGGLSGAVIFTLLLFLAVWAGGIWLTPFGPVFMDVYWLPFLVAGLIVVLLIFTLVPRKPYVIRFRRLKEAEKEEKAQVYLGIFFWILVFLLILSIAIYYIRAY